MTALRESIAALLAIWEDNHADWCCSRGCTGHSSGHATPEAVHEWMEKLGRGESPGQLPTVPCTGQCTCDVALYTSSLRAALAEASE